MRHMLPGARDRIRQAGQALIAAESEEDGNEAACSVFRSIAWSSRAVRDRAEQQFVSALRRSCAIRGATISSAVRRTKRRHAILRSIWTRGHARAAARTCPGRGAGRLGNALATQDWQGGNAMPNVSPLLQKGAILVLEPNTGIPLNTIELQYNPENYPAKLAAAKRGRSAGSHRGAAAERSADRDHHLRCRNRCHRSACRLGSDHHEPRHRAAASHCSNSWCIRRARC